jgi:general secretion pathway protein A
MFLQHFKLDSQPFAERVCAEAVWPDERLTQGLARLTYLAEQGSAALLLGETGVGKSVLLKRFLRDLSGPRYVTAYVHLTHLSGGSLLRLLVSQLGEKPCRGKERLFEQVLAKAGQAEGSLVVVVDEAHLLSSEALVDLRLLISSALDDAPPLKVVLSGQESLRKTLRQDRHADLLNRISVHYHLSPLSAEQTAAYIDFQVKQAGGSEKLFAEEVKATIHQ